MSDGKEARIGGELGEVPGGGDKLFQAFSTTLCEDWHATCRVTLHSPPHYYIAEEGRLLTGNP